MKASNPLPSLLDPLITPVLSRCSVQVNAGLDDVLAKVVVGGEIESGVEHKWRVVETLWLPVGHNRDGKIVYDAWV